MQSIERLTKEVMESVISELFVSFRQACVTGAIGHWYSPLNNEEKANGQYDPGSR